MSCPLKYVNLIIMLEKMTFSRSKILPQILTSTKSMEVIIYVLQLFFYNSLLSLEDTQKVPSNFFVSEIWLSCFRIILKTDTFRLFEDQKMISNPSYVGFLAPKKPLIFWGENTSLEQRKIFAITVIFSDILALIVSGFTFTMLYKLTLPSHSRWTRY